MSVNTNIVLKLRFWLQSSNLLRIILLFIQPETFENLFMENDGSDMN